MIMLQSFVSKTGLDPEWDSFLEAQPDGCYQQSSLWAELNATNGWDTLRIVVRERNEIVGGAQLLLRSLPFGGSVGYVPKGPIVSSNDSAIQEYVLNQIDRVARMERLLFLKFQPPFGQNDLCQRLLERGARLNALEVTPLVTAQVDLRPTPEAILAQMSRGRRTAIRRAQREWVTVRAGTQADIPAYFRLAQLHGDRRGYDPYTEDYYHCLWSLFAPDNRVSFLVGEYDNAVLAVIVVLFFGDVATAIYMVDSGARGELNIQTLLIWEAILRARDRGCAWFDFGGIHQDVAQAVEQDEPFPDTVTGRQAWFKMSFGSKLITRPGICDLSYVWPKGLTVRLVPALVKIQPLLRLLIGGSLAQVVRRRDRQAVHGIDERGS